MIGWIIFCIIMAIIILVLIQKVYIDIKYETALVVIVKFLFFKVDLAKVINKRRQRSRGKKGHARGSEQERKPEAKMQEAIESLKLMYKPIADVAKYSRKKFVFDRFWLAVKFSTGDPAKTAITSGAVCSVIFPFVSFLEGYFKFKEKKVAVTPSFEDLCFEFYYWGILSSRLATIIIAIIIFFFSLLKELANQKTDISKLKGVSNNG